MKASHRIAGIVAVVVSSVFLIAFTYAYDWFPTQLTPGSGKIDGLYKLLTAVSIPFFVLIVAFMVFCLVEFRVDPSDPPDKDGEPIHGSTRIELIWTGVPLLVILLLGIYSWVVLDKVEAKQKNPMVINVTGQQYIWNYEYVKNGSEKLGVKTSSDLVVPVNKPLEFRITSLDVIHSFWVPAARLKRDATAGVVTPLRFTPEKTGSYDIVCTELCGVGHSTMRGRLKVVSTADWVKWLKAQKSGGAGGGGTPGGGPDGKQIFTSNGCGGCHKLAAADGAGTTGPALDGAGLSADELRESIVDPGAKIANGFPNVMPATFGKSLSKEELDALVKFLAEAGK
ncbi:MAG: cytochrome c oxidase subunit II [Actinobacteria bacterium]|nr:cytochrome c oxidase subunit II [Actinomycetota bacterium]